MPVRSKAIAPASQQPGAALPHNELMKPVARRIADGGVLRLIKLWLKAPIEEQGKGNGKRRISGGKRNARGTPQGGVASPLLANIYMSRFLKHWRLTERGKAFRAHVVAYADDFVILSRGPAADALAWTKAVMTRLGLILNEAKTSVKNVRQERFDFLGYSFGPYWYKGNGQWYLSASPSKKSVQRLNAKVADLLAPDNRDALNGFLFGWSRYFSHGTHRAVFRGIDYYVYERVRDFLARRHKMRGRGTRRFSCNVVYGERGVLRLERLPWSLAPCASRCDLVRAAADDLGETSSRGKERLYSLSQAALTARHAEIFVVERAAGVPSAGISLAIRRRSFSRAAGSHT